MKKELHYITKEDFACTLIKYSFKFAGKPEFKEVMYEVLKLLDNELEVNLTDENYEGCGDCEFCENIEKIEPCNICKHAFYSYYKRRKDV